MLSDAVRAFRQVFTPPFRAVFFKSLGLTLLGLFALWLVLTTLIGGFLALPWPWLEAAIQWATGTGLFIGAAFLVGPVTAIVATLFLDDISAIVEANDYPADTPGRPLPVVQSVVLSLRFFLVVVAANLFALMLLLVPGVNLAIFFVVNGYLLGREFFELAAFRHHRVGEATALRKANAGQVFAAGLMIAGVLAIPLVNLITPLFATAFMVHFHKRVAAQV